MSGEATGEGWGLVDGPEHGGTTGTGGDATGVDGWWTGIKPYTIERMATLVGKENPLHPLKATSEGIAWGPESRWRPNRRIPWRTLRGIETSDSTGQKVTAGRVLTVGVFALAWKKKLTGRIVFEAEDQIVAFDIPKNAAPVLANRLLPITNALALAAPQPPGQSAGAASVADELTKLLSYGTPGC